MLNTSNRTGYYIPWIQQRIVMWSLRGNIFYANAQNSHAPISLSIINMTQPIEERRSFIKKIGLAGLGIFGGGHISQSAVPSRVAPALIKPPALQPGQKIALTAPAGAVFYPERIEHFLDTMNAIGLRVMLCDSLHKQHGYFSSKDAFRAAELNSLFRAKDVHGIIAVRGGWGGSRILPMLDFDLIKENPKVFMGYSDITSLLNGIYKQTGLLTFHGPMGYSLWGEFSKQNFLNILSEGHTDTLLNPPPREGEGVVCLVPGQAEGELVGGNLTVLTSLLGTPYMPDLNGKILFIEEVNEEAYRIDRMLTQLKLAGAFDQVSGFIFGKCIQCEPEYPEKALSFWEVLREVVQPLGIPSFYGAMVGHLQEQLILPVGGRVVIDAKAGRIQLLESVVAD